MIHARGSIASALLLVAACSSSSEWTRDGTSREAMEADARACDAAARASAEPPDADRQLDLAERVDRCMRGRGYTFQRTRRLLM